MRKVLIIFSGLVLVCFLIGFTSHSAVAQKSSCVTIKDGTLIYGSDRYLAGQPLKPGFDMFGYNYQAHLFNGYVANYYFNVMGLPPYEGDDEIYYQRLVDEGLATDLDDARAQMAGNWLWPWRKGILVMKWNDAWLSNKDCDGDGKLDRHNGHETYIGSGAWETNNESGVYTEAGEECNWNYFVKIVAPPEDATLDGGIWYTADGTEIGPEIWGEFAITQQVERDPCAGLHGVTSLSPAGPGFGRWK